MRILLYILITAAIFPAEVMYAQESKSCLCNATLDSIMEPVLTGDLYQTWDKGIGSQYYTDEWLLGDVYLTNKTVVKDKYLRFNQYYNKLMWLTPINHQQVMLDKEQMEGFCLKPTSGLRFCFQKIPVKPDLSPDSLLVFGQILYKDSISLFIHRKVERSGYEVMNSSSSFKNVYNVNVTYYFMMENGRTIGFKKCRKRHILELFPDHRGLILAKLKELKQRHFRSVTDLQNITQVLNEVL